MYQATHPGPAVNTQCRDHHFINEKILLGCLPPACSQWHEPFAAQSGVPGYSHPVLRQKSPRASYPGGREVSHAKGR